MFWELAFVSIDQFMVPCCLTTASGTCLSVASA